MTRAARAAASIVRWLTHGATVLVLVQGVALDGYLRFAAPLYLCILLLVVVGTSNLVRWWERSWSTTGASLAPVAVLLSVSSASALYLTTLSPAWEARGNGPIVTSVVLGAAAIAVAVHARLGPRLRWVLPAVSAVLVASAAWIEIDRWWVTAVLAFYEAGLPAFVAHIEWAWPIHRITLLLGVAATSVVLHWLAL